MSVYPLVTWRVPVPSFTVTVDVASVVRVLTVPAGNYWGWRTTGVSAPADRISDPGAVLSTAQAHDAAADSLIGVLAATIGLHDSVLTSKGLYWTDGLSGVLVTDALFTGCLITATSNPAALALFGIGALPAVITVFDLTPAALTPIARSARTAGVWRPAPVADPVTIEPRVRLVGQGAWSPYNPAENDRVRVGATRLWETLWEYCAAADVSREFARQNNYLSVAGRAAGDTAGTFEDLLDAASRRYEMALALQRVDAPTQPIHYVPVILPVTGDLDAGAYITDAGAGQRLYTVSMAMLEAGNAVL
jgi:hypothetical protein